MGLLFMSAKDKKENSEKYFLENYHPGKTLYGFEYCLSRLWGISCPEIGEGRHIPFCRLGALSNAKIEKFIITGAQYETCDGARCSDNLWLSASYRDGFEDKILIDVSQDINKPIKSEHFQFGLTYHGIMEDMKEFMADANDSLITECKGIMIDIDGLSYEEEEQNDT